MASHYVCILGATLFGSLVSGLSVNSPASGSQLDVSRKTTVTWSSNSSDLDKFDLYLINDAHFPSVSLKIAGDTDTSAGSYSFDGIDVIPGSGYRFDLKDTNDGNILAQSDQFVIVSKGSDTTVASAGGSSTAITTTATTATTTATATETKPLTLTPQKLITPATTITSTSSDDDASTVTETEVATTETTTRTTLISSSTSSSEYVSVSSTPSSSSAGDAAASTTPNAAPLVTCRRTSSSIMGAVIALAVWMC
ncbi:hypothetical protein ASPVEDRAFT_33820 [Aspergillus versicolor CBS 583.65]|uniref:Yeast cell wall synthesis Kre9/Knh1-like N-terminal domain-containing protein n=1 Tax=Aspergillus versicolor CBS 583.65 TaxID=1036611 RepID=A0A1L9Q1G3_ASPVE|nr:uncharacterized protein ASPVEDRAFT_33820 [Aspergillus versicolor CBS 583.65]OJJ07615.1 hypothetical protein ASPVEDRAFT_33820 [Aspergillus versicolor CBS 583.65]